jgi:hypothetical protein
MVNTHNRNTSENNANNVANNLAPPPTLEQILVMQAQMLQTIQQSMANIQAQG